MAGYNDDFSRSRNASAAESRDCFPATRLAKMLGVKTGAVKAILVPAEWHHTSARYNRTDYYDGGLLLLIGRPSGKARDYYDDDEIAEAKEQLAKLREWKPAAKATQTWTGCTVKWMDWGGTRKRPTASEESAENCAVEWKGGKFCTITPPDGTPFRKGISTRGFSVFDSAGKKLFV